MGIFRGFFRLLSVAIISLLQTDLSHQADQAQYTDNHIENLVVMSTIVHQSTELTSLTNRTDANSTIRVHCTNVTLEASYIRFSDNVSIHGGFDYKMTVVRDYLPGPGVNTTGLCFPLSPQLLRCNTTSVDAGTYRIERFHLLHGNISLADLGDYYVASDGRAVTCSQLIQARNTEPRCNFLQLSKDKWELLPNGSLSILPAGITLNHPQYVIADESQQQMNVCYPLSINFLNCKQVSFTPFLITIRSDFQIFFESSAVPLGEYYYDAAIDCTVICDQNLIVHIYKKLYVASTTCIFLAFLYQLLMNKHTVHRKCLLCHHGNWAVNNAWYTYYNYTNSRPYSTAETYIGFVVGYLSGIATASWLIIASFDVWRSFANVHRLKTVRQPFGNRRIFLYYSILGWGLPILALGTFLILNLTSSRDSIFSLTRGWFNTLLPSYIFFFGPLNVIYCTSGILFLLTVFNIRKAGRCAKDVLNRHRNKQVLLASVRLFGAMGVCWLIKTPFWLLKGSTTFPAVLISDGLVSVQGMVLLPIIVCNSETVNIIKQKMQRASSMTRSSDVRSMFTIDLPNTTNEMASSTSGDRHAKSSSSSSQTLTP